MVRRVKIQSIYSYLYFFRFDGITFFVYVNVGSMKKRPGNPKWGGSQQECKVIQRRADQWCRDNGYPIQRRKYWQKRKWTPKN